MTPSTVTVIYALPDRQDIVVTQVDPGATIATAIAESQLLARHPDIDLNRQRVGVFGQLATLDTLVNDGDRIEIYRPLTVDPKEARRRLAALQRIDRRNHS